MGGGGGGGGGRTGNTALSTQSETRTMDVPFYDGMDNEDMKDYAYPIIERLKEKIAQKEPILKEDLDIIKDLLEKAVNHRHTYYDNIYKPYGNTYGL